MQTEGIILHKGHIKGLDHGPHIYKHGSDNGEIDTRKCLWSAKSTDRLTAVTDRHSLV